MVRLCYISASTSSCPEKSPTKDKPKDSSKSKKKPKSATTSSLNSSNKGSDKLNENSSAIDVSVEKEVTEVLNEICAKIDEDTKKCDESTSGCDLIEVSIDAERETQLATSVLRRSMQEEENGYENVLSTAVELETYREESKKIRNPRVVAIENESGGCATNIIVNAALEAGIDLNSSLVDNQLPVSNSDEPLDLSQKLSKDTQGNELNSEQLPKACETKSRDDAHRAEPVQESTITYEGQTMEMRGSEEDKNLQISPKQEAHENDVYEAPAKKSDDHVHKSDYNSDKSEVVKEMSSAQKMKKFRATQTTTEPQHIDCEEDQKKVESDVRKKSVMISKDGSATVQSLQKIRISIIPNEQQEVGGGVEGKILSTQRKLEDQKPTQVQGNNSKPPLISMPGPIEDMKIQKLKLHPSYLPKPGKTLQTFVEFCKNPYIEHRTLHRAFPSNFNGNY